MERYIRFVVRHRLAVVLAVLLVTALLATQLRNVHLEIRRRANLPQDHPYVQIQNRISDLFGGEAVAVIGVVANNGDIFTPEILGKVYRITQGLRSTPGVIETSLFSLAAPYVKAVVAGADGMMDIHALMDRPITTKEDIQHLRDTVRTDKLFHGNLVSADDTATVIVAEFDDRLTDVAIYDRINEIVTPERDDSVTIALAGAPVLRAWLTRYTALIKILFPLAVLVIGLIHYEAFRTLQAMFLPLVTALLSVVWALGIMGLLGQPMDTWSAITPVVILAVAAGHAVQILKRYYEEYAIVGDSEEAVIRSVTAVGPVMLTAGCIASAGFASLTTFGVTSVRVFGLLLASGILSALVIEMTFTPACRCLLPAPKGRETRRERESRWLDPAMRALANLVVSQPRLVLLVALAVAIVAAIGVVDIDVDNSFRLWFAPSTAVRRDDALLNDRLPGTASLRILVEGEHENTFQDPAVLNAMSDLETFLERDPRVAGVNSIADQVKRMHQAMNNGDPAFYAIPDNSRLISQYLLLYSIGAGPDGLSAFVDANYQRGVIRALSKTDSSVILSRSPAPPAGVCGPAVPRAAGDRGHRGRYLGRADRDERCRGAREDRQHDSSGQHHLPAVRTGAALLRRGHLCAHSARACRRGEPRHHGLVTHLARHDNGGDHSDGREHRRGLRHLPDLPHPRGSQERGVARRRNSRQPEHLRQGDLLRLVGGRPGVHGAAFLGLQHLDPLGRPHCVDRWCQRAGNVDGDPVVGVTGETALPGEGHCAP